MKIVIWVQVDDDAWFGGQGSHLNSAIIKLASLYGNIEIVGMIDSEKFFSPSHGTKLIDKEDLKSCDCDLIVVSGDPNTLVPIWNSAKDLGIDSEKFVLDRTICTNNFSLKNYRKLCRSRLSILSRNCWGGLLFSMLGLKYNSPTVNMMTDTEEQFLEFLKDPMKNLASEPEFVRMDNKHQQERKFYPVFKTGVAEWHMNHYLYENKLDGGYALKKWRERLKRINWFNLLVAITTKRPEIAEEFDKLPYSKKVCLTNFHSDLDSVFYVPTSVNFDMPSHLAYYIPQFYDVWDMLLYGKKTPLFS